MTISIFSILGSQGTWPLILWALLLAAMPIFFIVLSFIAANKNHSKLNILFEVSLFCSIGYVLYEIVSVATLTISDKFLSKEIYDSRSALTEGLISIITTYVIFFVFILTSHKKLTAGE